VRSTPPLRPCVYACRNKPPYSGRDETSKGGAVMCEARPRRARASTHVETSRRLSDAAQPKNGGGGAVRTTPPPQQRPCVSLRM